MVRGGHRGGHNGGAISDGNARHVGMRRTPPLLIRERFVVFFIDDSRNGMVRTVFPVIFSLNINSSFQNKSVNINSFFFSWFANNNDVLLLHVIRNARIDL